jgi:hypothetical protein
MNDKEVFAAQTQRHLTYLLVYALIVLIGALIIGAFLPFQVNDKILALANPLITGIYGLASGATGFWIAKQRYQTNDPDTTTTTTISNSSTASAAPLVKPPENTP